MKRIALLILLAACGKPKPGQPDAAPGTIVLDVASETIRTGPVGPAANPATYVYVDVANQGDVDRRVIVDGHLLGKDGQDLGALEENALRVPAHQARTFALVAGQALPDATGAKLRVQEERPMPAPEPLVLKDFSYADGVAKATLVNPLDRRATGISVAATFYGADGKILARPFTLLTLDAHTSHAVQLSGPKEAARAVMFVADSMYW